MIDNVRAFAAFWYDFIVGDDWRVAAGVVLALAATSGLSRATELPVWWIVVAAVVILLPLSIRRVTKPRQDAQPPSSSST
jgi:hypothetical protein